MKQLLLFIFSIGLAVNSFGQTEFNSKFKAIPPLNVKPKPKKEKFIQREQSSPERNQKIE